MSVSPTMGEVQTMASLQYLPKSIGQLTAVVEELVLGVEVLTAFYLSTKMADQGFEMSIEEALAAVREQMSRAGESR